MSATNHDKGRSLEQAVKVIQEAILESSPEVVGKNCTIETNVRLHSAGVTHEIDVVVRTNLKSDYAATWIFECKNWSNPVDKDVVIVLAEKVEAFNAAKGFLVAKSITSGAEAQLKKNPRLSYIRCSEDFSSPLLSIALKTIAVEHFPVTIKIHFRDQLTSSALPPLDYSKMPCRWFGQPVDFFDFMHKQIDQATAKELKERNNQYQHIGIHWGQPHVVLDMQYGELELNGFAVDSIEMPLFYFVITANQKILTKFELEGRGRFISFEPIPDTSNGKNIEITLVQKF